MPDDTFKRLFAEFLELESKLKKLDFCLKDSNVGGGERRDMLTAQYNYMLNYLVVLKQRIEFELKQRCNQFVI